MEEYSEKMGEWLNETVVSVPYYNWLYKIVCFLFGKRKKKMTYQELFLLLYGLNRNKVGDKKAKEMALYKIVEFYKTINNKLPNGITI